MIYPKFIHSVEVETTEIPKLVFRQPIEIQYNLPMRYNPNKRKFRPNTQVARARQKKKAKLNLIGLIVNILRRDKNIVSI